MDVSTLKIVDVAEFPKSGRGRPALANPLTATLADSYEHGQAKAVVVPEGDPVQEVVRLVKHAAKVLGIGYRLHVSDPAKGKVKVTFVGAEKRAYKPRTAFTLGQNGAE